jgi:hypothetical protein
MGLPVDYGNFESTHLGCDETNGRFGEVNLQKCKQCSSIWLHYFVEYESMSKSGRWYRGIISDETSKHLTPESAVLCLDQLDWHFYGGSYFEKSGKGKGKVNVDL